MGKNSSKIDWKRLIYLILSISLGITAGIYGQPYIHGNVEATNIIVNVFSILAGFLVAIMTILSEQNLTNGKTWRSTEAKRRNFYNRLVRYKFLFLIYLLTLGLIFLASLILHNQPESRFVLWLERSYLGFATFAFMLSLVLPSWLMNMQLARFNETIKDRQEHGI